MQENNLKPLHSADLVLPDGIADLKTEVNTVEQVAAQNALIESMLKLADSDDEEDRRLHEEIRKKFTAKMKKFNQSLSMMPRTQRRKFKDYNSFSKQYKSKIGLN